MPDLDIDLLVLIVVSSQQSRKLMANLNKKQFYFTIIESTNSLFHDPTVCLLLGLNHDRIDPLINLVNKYCKPVRKYIPVQVRTTGEQMQLPVIEGVVGGATLYAMTVDHFEQV